MPHKTDCPCPACRYRRGEGKGRLPHLSVRISEPIKQAILEAPEGARAYLERLIQDEQASAEQQRELRDLRAKVTVLEHLLKQAHQAAELATPAPVDQAERPARKSLFQVVIKELPYGLVVPKGWVELTRVKASSHEEAVLLAVAKLLGKRCQFQPETTAATWASGRQIGIVAPLKGLPAGARVSVECTRDR